MDHKVRPAPKQVEVPDYIQTWWDSMDDRVVKIPDPILRQIAQPIAKPDAETRHLVDRMKVAMADARGVGLAAPQMGVSQRLIIYKLPEEKEPLRVVINPKIVSMKGEQTGPEGCLSMPSLNGDVVRAREVIVKGMDMLGRPFRRRATDFEARILQHEIDHLDGILFVDRAILDTLAWPAPDALDEEGAIEE